MVRNHPINCPHCHKFTGRNQEDFMFYVMTSDFLCPHCGKVVIHAPQVEFSVTNIGGINFPTTQMKTKEGIDLTILDYPDRSINGKF